MKTTTRIKISELANLTKSKESKSLLAINETKEETRLRIRKAIENVKKGKNTVSFTFEEFEKYSAALSAKYRK
jgi:hypothetical protein